MWCDVTGTHTHTRINPDPWEWVWVLCGCGCGWTQIYLWVTHDGPYTVEIVCLDFGSLTKSLAGAEKIFHYLCDKSVKTLGLPISVPHHLLERTKIIPICSLNCRVHLQLFGHILFFYKLLSCGHVPCIPSVTVSRGHDSNFLTKQTCAQHCVTICTTYPCIVFL